MLSHTGDHMPRPRVAERAARAPVRGATLACVETQDATADRHSLAVIGLIYAAVTATVIGTAVFVVTTTLDGKLTLPPAVVSAPLPVGS